MSLLAVNDLRVHLATARGVVRAVDGVSFSVEAGKSLGIVGESGCGKTMTALALMRLIPVPPARIVGGSIRFAGHDVVAMDAARLRALRGGEIAMIYQDPMSSLNPVITVGEQIAEAVRLHRGESRSAAWLRASEMLRVVGIPDPDRVARAYPHQLSGGMRQRVVIGMALACNPKLLIADEPTTALDVTIQAQILALILDLQKELGTGLVLITHDLGVVAQTAQRVVVMYAGKKVEEADVESLFARPLHPYTSGLMASIPELPTEHRTARETLAEIPGAVPSLARLPAGCAFAPRCALATERCRTEYPPLKTFGRGHLAACWHAADVAAAS